MSDYTALILGVACAGMAASFSFAAQPASLIGRG